MAKNRTPTKPAAPRTVDPPPTGRPSSLLDTRVVYCGLRRAQSSRDNLEQLAKLPECRVDLIYLDPPFKTVRQDTAGRCARPCG